METVLIAGGTGLIGHKLSEIFIQNGYKVRILSRRKLKNDVKEYFVWDVKNQYIEENALENVQHLINLTGANIGSERWSKSRKKEILESRIQSADLLFKTVERLNIPLKTFITSSAVGYYGSTTVETIFKESDQPANDFLGQVCMQWEDASLAFKKSGIRTVQIRTGVVLAKEEGALPKMLKPIKMGFGAVLGSGKQYIPWIHIDDICDIYKYAVQHEKMEGAYNAVSPQFIDNKDFTHLIAKKLDKKILLPAVPAFVLKLVLGEMSLLVLEGSRISAEKILTSGYQFKYENLEDALENLLD